MSICRNNLEGRSVLCAVFALLFLARVALGAVEEYIVQSGDTLGAIARKFELTTRALQEANAPIDPYRLRVGAVLKIPPRSGALIDYMVQPGDMLESIARAHGVTARTLTDFNNLANPDRLRVGQVIQIPRAGQVLRGVLPVSLQRELNQTKVRSGWKYIVIHHSGTKQGSIASFDRYHREGRKMVNGLAYHFVIGNGNGMPDGQIGVGPRWGKQLKGGHLASEAQNRVSLGICLVGNYEVDRPTAKQMQSLRELVHYLQTRCNIGKGAVRTHRQINIRPTICPGRNFPTDRFIDGL